ncbi:membrane-anchored junction protein [Indicator indicator]|uniref:membrane-anchored junction protein n=1 Tax=Indicator indicator TaxID=1002788 RepID=UPI0023E0065E|nr:membrane-anchored junction protein [Indicator indicator]
MSLKPFTYPWPETRFLHAGRLVYKFKIRYGNFPSTPELDNLDSAAKELEEAIRVVLGNLHDLHPFSTDHFTVFPYLRKWERVSKMRFQHGSVHLVPYPYICTMYLELNSFQQKLSAGKSLAKFVIVLNVKRRSELLESPAVGVVVKRRRVEVGAEASYPQLGLDRGGAEGVHHMSTAKHGFKVSASREEKSGLKPTPPVVGCTQGRSWGPAESNLDQRAAAGQAEGARQLPQQRDQMVNKGKLESAGGGLSKFWRRIFSPLQQLFAGKN